MPDYSYDKDYPFAAFITNLGKCSEGELVGEWVKFPTTHEKLREVFKRIGIGGTDDFRQPYEEWSITDYDCYVDGLYDKLGEYVVLNNLLRICKGIVFGKIKGTCDLNLIFEKGFSNNIS